MKTNLFLSTIILLFVAISLSGCEIAGDVFAAGAWTGIIGLVLGIALVIWLVSKLFGQIGRAHV